MCGNGENFSNPRIISTNGNVALSSSKINKNRYIESIKKLEAIYENIALNVTEVSKWRCPYKNADDNCTAKFGCRNQDRSITDGSLFPCKGSDKLDYRNAWEV